MLLLLLASLSFSLTDPQIKAVTAASNHLLYTSKIVEITVDGIPREIVILGEMHKKTKAASELGEKAIREFQYRGIEMPPINDLNSSYLQAVLMGIAVGIDRSVTKIRSWMGLKKGATSILDAMYRGFFITQENQVIYNGYLLGSLYADGFYYDHQRVQKLIPQLSPDTVDDFFSQLQLHTSRNLKARQSVDLSFLSVKGINPFPAKDKMVRSEYLAEITIGIEFGELDNFSSRNERMAKNIYSFLKEYPEASSMLVIVGGLHVSPIKDLLLSY